jgi:hypothetical protein
LFILGLASQAVQVVGMDMFTPGYVTGRLPNDPAVLEHLLTFFNILQSKFVQKFYVIFNE